MYVCKYLSELSAERLGGGTRQLCDTPVPGHWIMEGTMKGEDDSDNLIGVLLSMNHWFRKVYKPNENPKSRTQTQLSRTKKEVFQESTINNPGK